jgi:predicted ester cyclase
MTTEENKKLVLDHYESFVHRRDAEAVRKQLGPDFRDHEMPPGDATRPRVRPPVLATLHVAFPDLRIKIEDVVAEGDRVAVRAPWTGTHRGPRCRYCLSQRQIALSRSREWCSGASATARLWSGGRHWTVSDCSNS